MTPVFICNTLGRTAAYCSVVNRKHLHRKYLFSRYQLAARHNSNVSRTLFRVLHTGCDRPCWASEAFRKKYFDVVCELNGFDAIDALDIATTNPHHHIVF